MKVPPRNASPAHPLSQSLNFSEAELAQSLAEEQMALTRPPFAAATKAFALPMRDTKGLLSEVRRRKEEKLAFDEEIAAWRRSEEDKRRERKLKNISERLTEEFRLQQWKQDQKRQQDNERREERAALEVAEVFNVQDEERTREQNAQKLRQMQEWKEDLKQREHAKKEALRLERALGLGERQRQDQEAQQELENLLGKLRNNQKKANEMRNTDLRARHAKLARESSLQKVAPTAPSAWGCIFRCCLLPKGGGQSETSVPITVWIRPRY